ncbi:MAG: AMP-binding protein [Planctomycetes bacterium]|nr:AMP-binding protein [Planctomycetota bacterium]
MNLFSMLSEAAERLANQPAISCGNKVFTYEAFYKRTCALAGVLQDEGIHAGDSLAILHRNCHHFLEAYFAAAALKAVLVPLNVRLCAQELAGILDHGSAKALIAEPCFEKIAQAALAARSTSAPLPLFLSYGLDRNDSLDQRIEAYERSFQSVNEDLGDQPAQLYYTSGTTGLPKGVLLTHRNVYTHAQAAAKELGITQKEVWLHAAPLFHLADAWATWAITRAGGRHVMLPEFEAGAAFDLIAREGVTLTNLIPTMLVKMVHHPGAGKTKLNSMRRILSGGAPMALELLKRIEALFPCEYVQTYGLTETSPYLTFSLLKESLKTLPAEQRQRYRATTGRPMTGVEVRVVDEQGRDVPQDNATVG